MDPIFIVFLSVFAGLGVLHLIADACALHGQSRGLRLHHQSVDEQHRWYKHQRDLEAKNVKQGMNEEAFVRNAVRIVGQKIDRYYLEHQGAIVELFTLLKEAGEGKLEPAQVVQRINDFGVLPVTKADVDDEAGEDII